MSDAEARTVGQTQAFADQMSAHNDTLINAVDEVTADVIRLKLTAFLAPLNRVREQYEQAGGALSDLREAIKSHEALAEKVRATDGAAGDMGFYTEGGGQRVDRTGMPSNKHAPIPDPRSPYADVDPRELYGDKSADNPPPAGKPAGETLAEMHRGNPDALFKADCQHCGRQVWGCSGGWGHTNPTDRDTNGRHTTFPNMGSIQQISRAEFEALTAEENR